MPVRYVDIRRFVWMLISSEITGIYLWRSSLNPATSSSTWCWFQTAVAIKQEIGDDFFDLATVSGAFGNMRKVETGGVIGFARNPNISGEGENVYLTLLLCFTNFGESA